MMEMGKNRERETPQAGGDGGNDGKGDGLNDLTMPDGDHRGRGFLEHGKMPEVNGPREQEAIKDKAFEAGQEKKDQPSSTTPVQTRLG